jgi:hypothetical protein
MVTEFMIFIVLICESLPREEKNVGHHLLYRVHLPKSTIFFQANPKKCTYLSSSEDSGICKLSAFDEVFAPF